MAVLSTGYRPLASCPAQRAGAQRLCAMFLIGLEIKLDQLRRLGRDVLAFGVPQIVLSALVIGLYVWWRFAGWEASLVLGLGFALSSTVVVVPLLRDRDELRSPWGGKAFAILLAQDLAIVPLLLVVSLMVEQDSADAAGVSWPWAVGGAAVAVVGIVVGGRYGLPRILAIAENQKNEAAFVCLSLLGVLAAALAAESVGLSMGSRHFSPRRDVVDVAVWPSHRRHRRAGKE